MGLSALLCWYTLLYGQFSQGPFCPEINDDGKITKTALEESFVRCRNKKVNEKCILECVPGYLESGNVFQCIKNLKWNPSNINMHCNLEVCSSSTADYATITNDIQLENKIIVTYVAKLNKARRLPVWSITLMDGLNFQKETSREDTFAKHPCFEDNQGSDKDYGGIWDRGHLTPAADMLFSFKAALTANLYVNVAPQDRRTNNEMWSNVEAKVRDFYATHKDFYLVATGVCDQSRESPPGGLEVPKCFYKMICYKQRDKTVVVGFYSSNQYIAAGDDKLLEEMKKEVYLPRNQDFIYAMASLTTQENPWKESKDLMLKGRLTNFKATECLSAKTIDDKTRDEWKINK